MTIDSRLKKTNNITISEKIV